MGFIADNFWRDAPAKATPKVEVKYAPNGDWLVYCPDTEPVRRFIDSQGYVSHTSENKRVVPFGVESNAERCADAIREALANG